MTAGFARLTEAAEGRAHFRSVEDKTGGNTTSTRRRHSRTRPAIAGDTPYHRSARFPGHPCSSLSALRRGSQRCTTHNRQAGGSNPLGAMPVPERYAVSRGRRKLSSLSPHCHALVDTPLFQLQSGNGLRAARLIELSEVHPGSTTERTRGDARSTPTNLNTCPPMRMRP